MVGHGRTTLNKVKLELTYGRLSIDSTQASLISFCDIFHAEMSDLAQLEDFKKKCFLYEKDLQYGQNELNRFQTDMLGLWGGLQGEIRYGIADFSRAAVKSRGWTLL